MSEIQREENKMGTMGIPKLLISMSLPMIISMMVQALYNIVDSMFVSRLCEEALTAVSYAFPIQNFMIAVSSGTAVGINALLSRNLGEKKFEEANNVAKTGIFLALISAIVFAIIGITGSKLFFNLQTPDELIRTYGTQYMMVITVCSFAIFTQMTCERLLQSTGKTFYSMITQATGAIINIILDPILIFGLFGFPRLEVTGAAIATVFGQLIAALLAIYFNIKKNTDININFKGYRPEASIVKNIYRVGIPSILMMSIGSVLTMSINKILSSFSETAVAVYGVYFKLQSFIFMPVFGLTNGMVPIIAYNYGAKQKTRILDTIKLSEVLAISIMTLGLIAFQMYPQTMLSIFDASEHMLEIGVPALRTISWAFPFAGFSIVLASVFQAMGNGVYSLINSICRQLLTILPLAYIFAKFFGLSMVWWSIPLAEIVSLILSIVLFKRIYKLKIKNL